ncbi:putative protein serine/threonine kinase [Ceratobasidium sp. 428]|nr:putative protein serine/threonine kinase [Ceratobasidium sp. 428]
MENLESRQQPKCSTIAWTVCEYYHNKDLDTFVNIHTPSPSKRFQLLKGVIRGLNHVHKLLVVHGDLKASNVLVDNAGDVSKVCDFGSARINCACYCSVENQSGTVPWDSPELFEDDGRTSMSDIWAFGCLALEYSCGLPMQNHQAQFGEPPYDANHIIASKKMMYNEPPATMESFELGDPISKAVWDMMQKCWEFEPRNRPTAKEVLLAFDQLEVE